jgi:hypothetical protein
MTIFHYTERGIKPHKLKGDDTSRDTYATVTLASKQMGELAQYLGQLLDSLASFWCETQKKGKHKS